VIKIIAGILYFCPTFENSTKVVAPILLEKKYSKKQLLISIVIRATTHTNFNIKDEI